MQTYNVDKHIKNVYFLASALDKDIDICPHFSTKYMLRLRIRRSTHHICFMDK